jgi:hypothetical protein
MATEGAAEGGQGGAALIRSALAQSFDPGVLELLELGEMLGALSRRGGDIWLTLDEHEDSESCHEHKHWNARDSPHHAPGAAKRPVGGELQIERLTSLNAFFGGGILAISRPILKAD